MKRIFFALFALALLLASVENSYANGKKLIGARYPCLLYTSPSPRDLSTSRMPSSA